MAGQLLQAGDSFSIIAGKRVFQTFRAEQILFAASVSSDYSGRKFFFFRFFIVGFYIFFTCAEALTG